MNETLNERQLIDLQQAFSSVDFNNDGFVCTKDIPTIFTHLDQSYHSFMIEEDELEHLLNEISLDNSNQLTFTQFLMLIAYKINVNDTVEELQEAFRMFDRHDNGFIDIDDLWRGMRNLGLNLSRTEVEEMMQEADRNCNGKINFLEFIEMLRHTSINKN